MSRSMKIALIIMAILMIVIMVIQLRSQGVIPNGVQSIPLNPAGYCVSQLGPSVNGVSVFSWCADASNGGTWYGAVSGKNFTAVSQGPPGPPPGKNCTALKVNSVNADGSWNTTCGPGWTN